MLPFAALAAAAASTLVSGASRSTRSTIASTLPVIGAGLAAYQIAQSLTSEDTKENSSALYSAKEAADMIGISEYTLKRKIRDNVIKADLIGNKYMVSMSEIEKYCSENGKRNIAIAGSPSSTLATSMDIDLTNDPTFVANLNNNDFLSNLKDGLELQIESLNLQIDKLELQMEDDLVDTDERKIKNDILDLKLEKNSIQQRIKIIEMQIIANSKNE